MDARVERVGDDTSSFGEPFWRSLDIVLNALDNVEVGASPRRSLPRPSLEVGASLRRDMPRPAPPTRTALPRSSSRSLCEQRALTHARDWLQCP